MCIVLISVPVLAFLSMRLTSNQFIRETEQSLVNQASIFAKVYADQFSAQGGDIPGSELNEAAQKLWDQTWHPWPPVLNLRDSTVFPPLPDFDDIDPSQINPPDPRYDPVAEDLLALARAAQKTTLSGALFLDHRGVNIRSDRLQSFAQSVEVQAALAGRVGTALRDRGDTYDRHPLTSISRDTWYRVFVAYPVIVETQVIGVVYLSRTPSNFAKFASNERGALLAMLAATLLTAAIVGLLLFRLFSEPVRALSAQGRQIARGQLAEPTPLKHYGVLEVADLGENIMRMSKTLMDRSRQVSTYTDHVTHELKSPITAIQGAAELLESKDISEEARQKLQRNIETEAQRMNALLEKLRQMTRLRDAPTTGSGRLEDMLPELGGLDVTLSETSDATIPILPEHGEIIFQQLARNAQENGATNLDVSFKKGTLRVSDNGHGVPPENLGKVLDPFFTTRREDGGTGLGLAIVGAVLRNYGASISFVDAQSGAIVEIKFADT